MPKYEVKLYGDPVLKEKTKNVDESLFGTEELKTKVGNLIDTMLYCDGIGMAANQVGLLDSIVVYDSTSFPRGSRVESNFEGAFLVLINPHVVHEEGNQKCEEGCLSFPNLFTKVARPQKVTIEYQDLSGEKRTIKGNDFSASAFCHEIDHLNGILFIDRFGTFERSLIKKKLKAIQMAQSILKDVGDSAYDTLDYEQEGQYYVPKENIPKWSST